MAHITHTWSIPIDLEGNGASVAVSATHSGCSGNPQIDLLARLYTDFAYSKSDGTRIDRNGNVLAAGVWDTEQRASNSAVNSSPCAVSCSAALAVADWLLAHKPQQAVAAAWRWRAWARGRCAPCGIGDTIDERMGSASVVEFTEGGGGEG